MNLHSIIQKAYIPRNPGAIGCSALPSVHDYHCYTAQHLPTTYRPARHQPAHLALGPRAQRYHPGHGWRAPLDQVIRCSPLAFAG
jgi:hypothetical protein